MVAQALQSGSSDNCIALVLDVIGLPTADPAGIASVVMRLPLAPVPRGGKTIDGFGLKVLLSDAQYSRLFGAEDKIEGGEVALKFPKLQVATAAAHRAAFAKEAWIAAVLGLGLLAPLLLR